MGGEHVEGIVDACVRTPIDGDVTDESNDKGDEDALPYADITSRRCDGNETNHTTNSSTHSRGFASTQAVEEYPRHHGCSRGGIGVEERLDSLSVSMER